MWKNKKVAVILPTYKEVRSIRKAITDFGTNNYVDEIIVVDNNAEIGTEGEVRKTRAVLIKEPRQGYGYAIRAGINHAKADLLIIAEPDGSFDGKDIIKLLAYSEDSDMVFGSRTHVSFIHKGSDMNFWKRIGDVLLAKLVYVLFLCYPITDLGCTLRLTTREAWQKIARECQAVDAILATEWLLVAAKNKLKFIEIPINYKARVGRSTVSHGWMKKMQWGARKFIYIWKVWAYARFRKKLYASN